MKHTQSLERWGKFHVFAAKPFCLVLKQPYEQFLRFAEVAFGSVNIDKVDQRIADTRIVARQKSFSYFKSPLRRSQPPAELFSTVSFNTGSIRAETSLSSGEFLRTGGNVKKTNTKGKGN